MTQVGVVYGQALYDLAAEAGIEQELYDQLLMLDEIFYAQPDYLRLLSAVSLSRDERIGLVDDCFAGKIDAYLNNFLKLLTQRGYARSFHDCVKQYREQYNSAHNILPVRAVTCVPLSAEQKHRLEEKLCHITGKHAQLINRVDPAVLGGVRLDYDGTQVDDTVASRIEAIGKLLKNTVL